MHLGDDLEVIWYHMHLEESRTLHALSNCVLIVEMYCVINVDLYIDGDC